MSKRLQVILDEAEYAEVERAARRRRMTVSEWVRQSLRKARRAEPEGSESKKIDVVRAAAEHDFPTAEIDRMLAEIQKGYLGERATGGADDG
jgi:hypothetical protein